MRTIIAFCLIAVACADQLGYNYQPVGHSTAGLSFVPGGASSAHHSSQHSSHHSSHHSSSHHGGYAASGSIGSGSLGIGVSNSGSGSSIGGGGGGGVGAAPAQAQAELTKEYYTFSAPEEDAEQGSAAEQVQNSLKQSVRVIFIKGPENRGLENAALNLARSVSEQKTAIYILTKQADLGSLANQLNIEHNVNNNKPEVHFVKYRTPEDAANAQRQIQAQYDSLGGQAQSHDGGVAKVLNFASQQEHRASQAPQAPGSSYLPASLFRRLRR